MTHTLLAPFENLPYFTIEGFRQIAGEEIADDAHARTALHRWVKTGRLVPLKKGLYMHRRFYERHSQEPAFSPVVSAILQPQSYLSLEYVLQQHGVLTEITYPVTAVTVKNTRIFNNPLGTFVYRHLQPGLYQGFQFKEAYGVPYALASKAKALFDYLYLRPRSPQIRSPLFDLAGDLRLNLDEFTTGEREEFVRHVENSQKTRMGGVKMRMILDNLENHVWQR